MLTSAGLNDNKLGCWFELEALDIFGCIPEGVKNTPELLFATNVGRITPLFGGLTMPLFPLFRIFVFAKIFAARRLFTNGILQFVDEEGWFGT